VHPGAAACLTIPRCRLRWSVPDRDWSYARFGRSCELRGWCCSWDSCHNQLGDVSLCALRRESGARGGLCARLDKMDRLRRLVGRRRFAYCSRPVGRALFLAAQMCWDEVL
jgi:hypothetical protein